MHPHPRNFHLLRSFIVAALAAGSANAFAIGFITPSTPGWTFLEEIPVASGGFVSGPGTLPAGSPGSFEITVQQPGAGYFYTQQYAGTPLTQFAGLKYNTYIVSSVAPVTITMSFDFDDDLGAATPAYEGRAVFDPALLGAPAVGTWQTWDPMTQQAWYGSGVPGTRPLNTHCTQATPCTLAQIIGFFPNGGVLSDLFQGFFGFRLGSGGGPSQVAVNNFSIGTAGAGGTISTFNFAASAPFAVGTSVPALSDLGLLLLTGLLGLVGFAALRERTEAQ